MLSLGILIESVALLLLMVVVMISLGKMVGMSFLYLRPPNRLSQKSSQLLSQQLRRRRRHHRCHQYCHLLLQ
jgi:hypothetical protein